MGHVLKYWKLAFGRAWRATLRLFKVEHLSDLWMLVTSFIVGLFLSYLFGWGVFTDQGTSEGIKALTGIAVFFGAVVIHWIVVMPSIIWNEQNVAIEGFKREIDFLRGTGPGGPAFTNPESPLVWLLLKRSDLARNQEALDRFDISSMKYMPIPKDDRDPFGVVGYNRQVGDRRGGWNQLADASMLIVNDVLGKSYDVRDYSGLSEPLRNGILDKDDEFDTAHAKADFNKLRYSDRNLRDYIREALGHIDRELHRIRDLPRSTIEAAIEYRHKQITEMSEKSGTADGRG